MYLEINVNTLLKDYPKDSLELKQNEYIQVKAGQEFNLIDYAICRENESHVFVKFRSDSTIERTSAFVYSPHVTIHVDESSINTNNEFTHVPDPVPDAKFPGYDINIVGSSHIIPGGHFTWNEATKNLTRIPENKPIVKAIIRHAHNLESVRKMLGNRPIKVNSWYRDPEANKACGGVINSRHLVGDATDISVTGLNPQQVYNLLDPNWNGGLGLYSWGCHVDSRGYRARW